MGVTHQSIQNATRPHVFRIRHRALCLHEGSMLRPRETHWSHYLASASLPVLNLNMLELFVADIFYIYIIYIIIRNNK